MTSLINIPLLQNRPINITYVYASHLFKTIYTVYAAIYWHTFYGHPCQDVGMWCNFVTQIRGALSVSPTFWEMKICIFCPTLGRSWCDFELVQFESEATDQKLKQAITARFRTRRCCSCWERRAVFFVPKLHNYYHNSENLGSIQRGDTYTRKGSHHAELACHPHLDSS